MRGQFLDDLSLACCAGNTASTACFDLAWLPPAGTLPASLQKEDDW